MFTVPIRALCAASGAVLLTFAALLIRTSGPTAVVLVPALSGFAMLAPSAMVARERMEEAMRRTRTAALLCFTFATLLFVASMRVRGSLPLAAQEMASLGVAFWAVAMLLGFGAAWYWSRARRA